MLETRLSQIKRVKWDFDGVFYDYETPAISRAETFDLFNEANALGACSVFSDLSIQEAKEIAEYSYNEHKDSVQGFIAMGQERGLDPEHVKLSIFRGFHENALDMFSKKYPELFEPNKDLIEGFDTTHNKGIKHSTLTHSCIDLWTKPLSMKMGIDKYFDLWLGYDDFNFIPKGHSSEPLGISFAFTKDKPEETAFVEDTIEHLEVAHKDYPDMVKIFKGNLNGKAKPDFVDVVVEKPAQFLKLMMA